MEIVKVKDNKIVVAEEIIKQIKEFNKQKLEMDLMEKELKENLKEAMEKCGVKSFACDGLSASYFGETTSNKFDTTRFKKECPEIYENYLKETKRASYITMKVTK